MAIPPNLTRETASDLGSLPVTVTLDVVDAGTAREVWYKFTAPATCVVRIWARGQSFGGYQPEFDIYEDDDLTTYIGFPQEWSDANVPAYLPVTAGHVYYLDVYRRTGTTTPTPAVLVLSVSITPTAPVQRGDFITNLETDLDAEGPLCVLAGDEDRTVRQYKQVATPVNPRGEDGLPHGEIGAIFPNGNVVWGDEQYSNLKWYDPQFTLLQTVTNATTLIRGAYSQRLQRFYALVLGSVGGHRTLNSYNSVGTLQSTLDTTIAVNPEAMGVNSDGSILYYSRDSGGAIKRWDLNGNAALSDLVAGDTGYVITDILVLENDTILACYHQFASTPRDVYVKLYATDGSLLQTYSFGDFWRSEFNPPRIGFALDSPSTFWICLKPEGDYGTSFFKNIQVSDGTVLATRTHTNFVGLVSLNSSGYGSFPRTPSSTITLVNQTETQTVTIIAQVRISFANGDGAQPQFKIGNPSDAEAYFPASTFTDATAGQSFTTTVTLAPGDNLKIQTIAATGATSTGSIFVSVFVPAWIETMGSEKAYPVLVSPVASSPTSGAAALDALRASGRLGTSYIVRLRRAPHLADEAQRIFYSKFQLDCQAGVGTVTGQGSDPIVELRWSNDGGFTWGHWRQLNIGKLGEYRFRAIAFALGSARDRVFEVRCSDPVTSAWLAAYLDLEEGTN